MAPLKKSLQVRPTYEKSVLALLLPHIYDLVFATIVFIAFLLIRRVLHFFCDSLDGPKLLFSLRVVELAVTSFGTVLCVLFLLKSVVRLIKKLCLRRHEAVEHFANERLHLDLGNIVRRFVEPLSKQPISFFILCLLVVTILYIGISFAEIVQEDSDDVFILACEMLCEIGPDFRRQASIHADMLENYSKYRKHKHLEGLLRALTGYSPEKELTDALRTVSDREMNGSQEEVANDVWRAGEEVMLFRLKAPRFLPSGIRLHEYREVSRELIDDIRESLEESLEVAKLFNEEPSLVNSVYSCEANRRTMLLMFLARKGGQYHLLDKFQEVAKACRTRTISFADTIQEDRPQRSILMLIAESEERRVSILEAMIHRDMQTANDLMWEAIELSYSRRRALQSLRRDLDFGPSFYP